MAVLLNETAVVDGVAVDEHVLLLGGGLVAEALQAVPLAVQGHLFGGALVLGMAQFGGLVWRGRDGLAEGGELCGLSGVVLSRG